ncbi:hypothetical protein [Streptomyces viridochromogenes]|uniref:hypothetical protein n=1 Tax=Streptomyces viridochromogenes TaxID=1938 RepID=UPI00069ED345|nr:hypothetical protein [Streptomyces viridochromogenes]KOG21997.1 hypothetical protein ADK36_13735 [Streptomyces viridochromogenes]
MALSPLATTADLAARGVTVAAEETAFVNSALATASAVVREAAGSPISETTSTVELPGEAAAWLHLPGLPVRSVSAVLLDGVAVTDWKLRAGALWRACGWQSGCDPSDVTVTYVHGLPEVPEDIVDLVCRMAGQALVKYRENPEAIGTKPVVQERIGDYSVTYAYELTYSDMELPKYLRRRLAARFGNGVETARTR